MNIRDMMQLAPFQQASILAGRNGIENKVLNATFIDAPDGYQWCKSGDFIVTTGYPFISNQAWEKGVMKLLKSLVSKNCAGVGVKLGRYIPDLPEKIVTYADENNLPIVSLPNDLSWSDVIVPIITQINQKQENELQKTHEVYEQFHHHLKVKGNLYNLADLLHTIIQVPITIYNRDYSQIIHTHEEIFPQEEIEKIISTLSCQKSQPILNANWNDTEFTVRWLYSSNRLVGGVFLWGAHSELQAWEKAALEQTSVITVLEIERIRTSSATLQHFRNDFLTELLEGKILEQEVIYRRAREVNWDLGDSYKVVLLDCYLENSPNENDIPIWQQKINILNEFENELRIVLPKTLIGFDAQNRYIFLVSGTEEDTSIINKIRHTIRKLNITSFCGGIGRKAWIEALSTSYKEAISAYQVAYTSIEESDTAKESQFYIRSFQSLDVERILFSDNPKAASQSMFQEYLKKVVDYDKKRNSDLLSTLKVFLDNNMNYDETANALFIHRNTVRYRIKMIQELTSLDLGNLKDLLLLQMAMTVMDSFVKG
ncbi:PucR family transcriptional regulator ligand-binding domain-containing protein [Oceanobacillus jeddahense]|uniref:PucR family transcriptional regulator ligand-binding domain-containing protein n=1 Tax=Oceanobacillus jeddahense TaxID=1462527 RepID=A0ABY5JRH7_9BACI|nr:PucR family transcriptional regulator [Oceanobacillus jeddahense]UUI02389.1 PucR family transcriptional regulator ligand-binding domain-containing protein [Oceanobacillus jeddahense]